MVIKKNREQGYTLVEVIVVAVLMLVLALGLYTLFNMYTTTTRETSANLRMQRQSEAMMDEIGRRVRESVLILALDEDPLVTGINDLPTNLELITLIPNAANRNVDGFILFVEEVVNVPLVGDQLRWVRRGGFRLQNVGVAPNIRTVVRQWQCQNPAGCPSPTDNDWNNANFSIDGRDIEMEGLAPLNNFFTLSAERMQILADVTLRWPRGPVGGGFFNLDVEGGTFRCRI